MKDLNWKLNLYPAHHSSPNLWPSEPHCNEYSLHIFQVATLGCKEEGWHWCQERWEQLAAQCWYKMGTPAPCGHQWQSMANSLGMWPPCGCRCQHNPLSSRWDSAWSTPALRMECSRHSEVEGRSMRDSCLTPLRLGTPKEAHAGGCAGTGGCCGWHTWVLLK